MSTEEISHPALRIAVSGLESSNSDQLRDVVRAVLEQELERILLGSEESKGGIPVSGSPTLIVELVTGCSSSGDVVLAVTKVMAASGLFALELLTGVPGLHALLTALGMEGVFFLSSVLEEISRRMPKIRKMRYKK